MSPKEPSLTNPVWCHVYSQAFERSEVSIQGTRLALLLIRDALDLALHTGRDGRSGSLFTADGEGYQVVVKIRNLAYLERQLMPYNSDWAQHAKKIKHGTQLKLAQFAKWAISEGPFNGCSLDGGSIQDKAVECGLLVKTTYQPILHGVVDGPEPGDPWFEFAEELNRMADNEAPIGEGNDQG